MEPSRACRWDFVIRRNGSDLRNDMFILPASYATEEGYYRLSRTKPFGFYITACIYLAVGAGEITLASPDPREQPVLDYNYLAESFDRDRLREAVRMATELVQHEAYEEIVSAQLSPANDSLMTDAALDDWMMREVTTQPPQFVDLQDGAFVGSDGGRRSVRKSAWR